MAPVPWHERIKLRNHLCTSNREIFPVLDGASMSRQILARACLPADKWSSCHLIATASSSSVALPSEGEAKSPRALALAPLRSGAAALGERGVACTSLCRRPDRSKECARRGFDEADDGTSDLRGSCGSSCDSLRASREGCHPVARSSDTPYSKLMVASSFGEWRCLRGENIEVIVLGVRTWWPTVTGDMVAGEVDCTEKLAG